MQKICAYDNVKGVGVEHFAVLSHLFIAQTDCHIDPPQGMDGPTIPNPYGHGFGFPDLGLLAKNNPPKTTKKMCQSSGTESIP